MGTDESVSVKVDVEATHAHCGVRRRGGCERSEGRASSRRARWPLERVLFALAGTMALLSALLAATVSPWFLLLTALVGVNQWLYVLVRHCPASIVLRR